MALSILIVGLLSQPVAIAQPVGDAQLVAEYGYIIPECSQAAGVYSYKHRETGEYRHIEHGLTLELFDDGKFLMTRTFDNTTAPDKFDSASFSGHWMEYTGSKGRAVKLLFSRRVDGEIWTLKRFIDRLNAGLTVDWDLETFGSDGLRLFSQVARRDQRGSPYCKQSNPAVQAFIANLKNDKAWTAVKVGFSGNRQLHLSLALEADRVFGGTHPGVLDTIAALYAATGDFDRAVQYENKALRLLQALPEPGDSDKKSMSEFETRSRLYRARQPYVEP